MRIAIFTDTYLPDLNGVATSSYTLRNALVRHGHEVYIITSELPDDSEYVDHENIIRLPGIEIKALYGYRISNLFSFKGMKEISHLDFDLIHIQTEFGIGIFGKLCGLFLNIPVVYTYHTMYEDYTHYVAGNSDSMNALFKKVAQKLSKVYGDNCTELIVPSIKTKEVLEKYGIEKDIHVIPTGLDLALFSPANKNQQLIDSIREQYDLNGNFTVGFVGRIAPEKSVDVLIEAIEKVKNPHVRLLIVGGGPHLDDLKKIVDEKQLHHIVKFTGAIEKAKIPNYYHSIDAFACASTSETQGLTYIEALATGTIVLARYDQNLENVVNDGVNGYFFNETEQLTEIIERIANEDLTEMEKHALADADKFSDETFYKDVIEVYKLAIEHKHFTYEVISLHELRKGEVEVSLKADNHVFTVKFSQIVLEKFNLYKGKYLEHEEFESLVDYDKMTEAYNQSLKYLTYKDLTEKQLYGKLSDLGIFDEIQIDMAMNALKEKNLINDEEYAKDYLDKARRLGLGKKKALRNLKEKGIDENLIEEVKDLYDEDEEYESALSIVEKSFASNTTKTRNNFIKSMREKLYMRGFSNDVISNVLANYDFSGSETLEDELIVKEFDKAFARYSDKFEGAQLTSHIYNYLLRKGFDHEAIREIMSGSEEYNEEN